MMTNEQIREKAMDLLSDPEKMEVSIACVKALRQQIDAATKRYFEVIRSLVTTYELEFKLLDFAVVSAVVSTSPDFEVTPDSVLFIGAKPNLEKCVESINKAISE